MKRSELKQSLKSAVLQSTPDLLPTLLPGYVAEEAQLGNGICHSAVPKKRARFQIACVVAAVCVMFLSVLYLAQPQVDSIVSIDVNPSIELLVDQNDRVIKTKASNEDAAAVLENVSLHNKDLKDATGSIIHKLLDTGYLTKNSDENAILISVASQNNQKIEHLQNQMAHSIEQVLTKNNAHSKVFTQADTMSDDLQKFADEYKVSVGKADLVRKLLEQNQSFDATELCKMTLKELHDLIEKQNLKIAGFAIVDETKPLPEEIHFESSAQSSENPAEATSHTELSEPERSEATIPSWKPHVQLPHPHDIPVDADVLSSNSIEQIDSDTPVDDFPPDIEDPDGVPDHAFDSPSDEPSESPAEVDQPDVAPTPPSVPQAEHAEKPQPKPAPAPHKEEIAPSKPQKPEHPAKTEKGDKKDVGKSDQTNQPLFF